jgi:hypothetical protein
MVKLYSDEEDFDDNSIFEKMYLWKKMHPIGRPAFIGATTLKECNNAQPQSVQGECTMNKSEAFEQYWASLGMQDSALAVTMRLIAEDVWAAAAAAGREACAKICDSYAENQKSWSYGKDDSAFEYRAQAANELADTIRESWNI